MKILIAGYGFLGQVLRKLGAQRGHTMFSCSRTAFDLPEHFALDLSKDRLDYIPKVDVVIYCASARSGASYNDVYVNMQKRLLSEMANNTGQYIFISSSRVYGGQSRLVDDDSSTTANDDAVESLLKAESIALGQHGALIVRSSGIYSQKKNPFDAYALSQRKDGLDMYTNRIHVDDLARAILFALESRMKGIILASDMSPLTRRQYRAWKTSGEFIEPGLGAEGKRCFPRRLLQEGFVFSYPDGRNC